MQNHIGELATKLCGAILFTVSVAGGLMGTRLSGQRATPAVVLDAEMYAVYASLIPDEWLVRIAKAKSLVIQEETVSPPFGCVPSGPPLEKEWKPALTDFLTANMGSHVVAADQPLGFPYKVVPKSMVSATLVRRPILPDEPQPPSMFPDSGGGYMMVSVVGFDRTRQKAIVYTGHYCGLLCGGGQTHLMERSGDRWRQVFVPGVLSCEWAS